MGSNCRKLVSGKVREQWGKPTDDDLDVIEGKQDQVMGRLEGRYSYSKDQAEKELKIGKVK
jgi:uncharacterized protein YjbJ (UPF0337 family)